MCDEQKFVLEQACVLEPRWRPPQERCEEGG